MLSLFKNHFDIIVVGMHLDLLNNLANVYRSGCLSENEFQIAKYNCACKRKGNIQSKNPV